VKALTLHDTKTVSWLDLSTQFYFSANDVGKNRAEVSAREVQELNPYTKVLANTQPINQNTLSMFDEYKVGKKSEK
jgi:ubiquitin-activating enzyme E1